MGASESDKEFESRAAHERATSSHRANSSHLSISQVGQLDTGLLQVPQTELTMPGSRVTLSWRDIRYVYKEGPPNIFKRLFKPKQYKAWKQAVGSQILDGVIGEIRPGEVIGIMGGSGAGKTTMLNILAGKVVGGQPSGTVIINGQPRDKAVWPYLLSYVEQEDILDENLTVREAIRFAVDMRNPNAEAGPEKRERKTQKILRSLGLEAIADRQIGMPETNGISGGERKRVSIGMELAAERRVLFLDEPTTGLDAATSLGLIETIAKLALKHQLSVIMSIHQPSGRMLQRLDKVLLLSLGRTVYFGSLEEIAGHLHSLGFLCPRQENPADWILDVISVDNSAGGKYRAESLTRIADLHEVWAEIEAENAVNFARLSRGPSTSHPKRRGSTASFVQRILGATKGTGSLPDESASEGDGGRRSVNSLFVRSIIGRPGSSHDSLRSSRSSSPSRDSVGDLKRPKRKVGYSLAPPAEFGFLLRRYGMIEYRNFYANAFLFGEFFLLSLIFGFVFFQLTTDNFGGFQSRIGLFATVPALIVGLISVDLMVLFTKRRRLMVRERFSHLYRLSNGYTANVLSVIPLRIITVTVYATIMYYLIGLRTDSFTYFLIYLGIVLLVTLFAILFGVFIAASSTGSLMAAVLRMIFIYIFLLFSGNLARTTDITPIISWMRFISPYFYALQSLIQNECIGLTIDGQDGIYYVELYGLNQFSIMWNAGALMIMCGATFIAGYIGLRITTKPKYIVI